MKTKDTIMKIELDSVHISIDREGDDCIARIRFNRADDRLIVGDYESYLLDEVIAVVQGHIKHLTEDLQAIQGMRSRKNPLGEKS